MPDWLTSIWFHHAIAGLFGLLVLLLFYRGLLRDRSRGRARCPKCWYDLTGGETVQTALPVTCPEFGRVCRTTKQLHRTRRRLIPVLLAAFLLLLTVYSYQVRYRMVSHGESIRTAIVPSTAYLLALENVSKETFEVVEARFQNRITGQPGPPDRKGFWRWQVLMYQTKLSAIVDHGDANLRIDALHLLLQMAAADDERALALFASHLDHDEPAIRKKAMDWAQSIAEKLLPFRDAVLDRINDTDPGVASSMVWVLVRMGPRQMEGMEDERLGKTACELARRSMAVLRDMYLAEMVRRGSPVFKDMLRKLLRDPPKLRWAGEAPSNLEVLTALRRLEGRDDPLEITVRPNELHCRAGALPQLTATIHNSDPEKPVIGFQKYGDNRGERAMRWRFEVRDAAGKLMPMKLESMNFGGISQYVALKPGEMYMIELDLTPFIEPLPPGEYHVIVQYHDSEQISSQADISHLIVMQSKPVKLIVEP